MPYANNKGADQPAHPLSLISTFIVRCLNPKLQDSCSVAEQIPGCKPPEDRFSCDAGRMINRSLFGLNGLSFIFKKLQPKITSWHCLNIWLLCLAKNNGVRMFLKDILSRK